MDSLCAGKLPEPVSHDGDLNTHILCFNGAMEDGEVFDLMINTSDVWWLIFTLRKVLRK